MKFTLTREKNTQELQVGGAPRVNLLPRAVAEQRAQRSLLIQWGVRIGAAVGVLALAVAGMFAWQGVVTLQLGTAEAEGDRAIAQIAERGEIQRLLDTENELQTFAEDALATHLVWNNTLAMVRTHFPADATLCGFNLTAGDMPEGDPTEQMGISGTVEICGPFPSAIPFLAGIRAEEQVTHSSVLNGKFDTSIQTYRHTLAISLDQTVYTSVQGELADADQAPETEDSAA